MSKKTIKKPLTCAIDRFEGRKAVLIFEIDKNDVQKLILPKYYLPLQSKEGDILHLNFLTDTQSKQNKKNLAYQILEEILKGNKNVSRRKTSG